LFVAAPRTTRAGDFAAWGLGLFLLLFLSHLLRATRALTAKSAFPARLE
jgi:hypothetical protein